jgi:hypothetical protein
MASIPFVFIHSPLVGDLTWKRVARYLRERWVIALDPELRDDYRLYFGSTELKEEAYPIKDAVFVGHSGAGALLPTLGEKLGAKAYIFVDAVLLFEPATRLDLLRSEDPEFAQEFEAFLRDGGKFPDWQDEQLKGLIPDVELRQKLLDDMRPRPLEFFTERIDVPKGWESKPCAYIQLSETYSPYATQAEARNWPLIRRESHHFEMLTNPGEIARLILQMRAQLVS